MDAQLVDASSPSPDPTPSAGPSTDELTGTFISSIGGNAGLGAVAGGLLLAGGGGAMWLKRRRAERTDGPPTA
ncbi:hypothetical protein GCM10009665_45970 [Kitasatospora nipponensis]|uniref:LPXTG-motif cell wall-anchored protein n=1 Tax=Kitasatospora nipponensis TaxID=258049 RepID=A0ABN1WNH2_9ACTN